MAPLNEVISAGIAMSSVSVTEDNNDDMNYNSNCFVDHYGRDDVDACIETLRSGECVSERALKRLCSLVGELLMEESNVQPVISPVTVSRA